MVAKNGGRIVINEGACMIGCIIYSMEGITIGCNTDIDSGCNIDNDFHPLPYNESHPIEDLIFYRNDLMQLGKVVL